MEAGPPIRAEPDDLGGFRRTDGQRPTRSDSAFGAINEGPRSAVHSLSGWPRPRPRGRRGDPGWCPRWPSRSRFSVHRFTSTNHWAVSGNARAGRWRPSGS